MKIAIALAVTALLALTTTQADATLTIAYDSSNRPTSVSDLTVTAAPFLVDIIFDYSGLSFNATYGSSQPPLGSPGGLTWGNEPLALSVATALRDAMNSSGPGNPTLATDAFFPVSSFSSTVETIDLNASGTGPWHAPGFIFDRSLALGSAGWATVTAVPEPSAFLCVGLVGLGFAAWKRRTANRDPS